MAHLYIGIISSLVFKLACHRSFSHLEATSVTEHAPAGALVLTLLTFSTFLNSFLLSISFQAIDKWTVEKDIAAYIKKEFDSRHGPTWHCIVGTKFGSYVTHETKHFIYFYLDSVAVLLFKSG